MKRLTNIYDKVYSIENLILADKKARRGKGHQKGVIEHDKNKEGNILHLRDILMSKTYQTSEYTIFKIFDIKEREIFRLPYFPDRITHHAIVNILEDMFTATFTADTFSCIKGRGIHKAMYGVKSALRDRRNTRYCLKLDIRKFYPSIDNEILKSLLRKKIKDKDLLWLLDEIIDSAKGCPIGNLLSQFFANFYLSYFDHWLKENKGVRYMFRYADDIVILHSDKEYLHGLLKEIELYLSANLKLDVKSNWQVFPVKDRGIDFVGYKLYHSHVEMRKRIKQRFKKMMFTDRKPTSESSYMGWAGHCDSKHLIKKLNQKQ